MTCKLGLLPVFLLSSQWLATPIGAQERTLLDAPFLTTLQGEWDGTGVLLGGQARFSMRWEIVDRGVVRLAFTNARMADDGTWTPVLSAHATYLVRDSTAFGVWIDDRPQRLSIDGVIRDSTFVANWTAEAESGRTEYQLRSADEVGVRDIVYINGSERTFAEATYHRRGPPAGVPEAAPLWAAQAGPLRQTRRDVRR